jgi:hypothetical protein
MRLQEFYESDNDNLKNKYFTFEDFIHHFTNENGVFNYTSIWSGFNVPSNIITEWYNMFSKQKEGLTNKETQVFDKLFEKTKNINNKWYLIATAKNNSKNIIRHEIAHGRFSTNELYKNKCLELISKIDVNDYLVINQSLAAMGYREEFFNDEIQAYLSTLSKQDIKIFFGKLCKQTHNIIKEFKLLYKNYKEICC